MDALPEVVKELVEHLKEIPGIGQKTGQRMALDLLDREPEWLEELAGIIERMPDEVDYCTECGALAEGEQCAVCADPGRDQRVVCVVEEPLDVISMERGGVYDGLYHVLGGSISPVDGVLPEDIDLEGLERRCREGEVEEVIVATGFDLPGNTTSLYIQDMLEDLDINVTRPARGLPAGADLEYVDEATLEEALKRRSPLEDE